MGSIQISSMSWERSGKPGRFSFFPKGALTHHPEGAVVFPAEIVRSPRGIAASADAAGQGCISVKLPALSMQSAQGFPFWKPLFMGWYIATPSRRLPVSTCHRQLDTDTGVEQIVPPLLVVRRISRRTERKQGCPVLGHPFQKGQGDLWRFIIWRPRWSAVEPDAPPWLLRPI